MIIIVRFKIDMKLYIEVTRYILQTYVSYIMNNKFEHTYIIRIKNSHQYNK